MGLALICAVDDECGTNVSTQLNGNKSLKSQTVDGKVYAGRTCKAVGLGVLSKIVVFANKMFATLAYNSINILAISTSEIKISVLIDKKFTKIAVKSLHEAYNLSN